MQRMANGGCGMEVVPLGGRDSNLNESIFFAKNPMIPMPDKTSVQVQISVQVQFFSTTIFVPNF